MVKARINFRPREGKWNVFTGAILLLIIFFTIAYSEVNSTFTLFLMIMFIVYFIELEVIENGTE